MVLFLVYENQERAIICENGAIINLSNDEIVFILHIKFLLFYLILFFVNALYSVVDVNISD